MLRRFLKRLSSRINNIDWILVSLILAALIVSALIMSLLLMTADTAEAADLQWQTLGDYSGGINTKSPKGQLAENQYLRLQNFLFIPGGIECRKGYYKLHSLSANSIAWVDVFHKKSGLNYLIISDGDRVWSSLGLTDTAEVLTLGRYNVGTVDEYAGVAEVRGNTVASQKWLAWLGSCENCQVKVGDTTRTISKIILDTLIYTTVGFEDAASTSAYSLDIRGMTVNRGMTFSDKYWLYTTNGRYYMDNPDSIYTSDTAGVIRLALSTPFAVWKPNAPYQCLRWTMLVYGDNYSGQFLRMTTDPKSYGGMNPIPAGHHFYTSYPIYQSGTPYSNVFTFNVAFRPDSAAEYAAIVNLTYDSTTRHSVILDSVTYHRDSLWLDGAWFRVEYNKAWCDSCGWDTDTGRFITGDYFVSRYSTSGHPSYRTALSCFPVIGGYVDTVGVGEAIYFGRTWVPFLVDHDTAKVCFFRMKRTGSTADSANYVAVAAFEGRVFHVRADAKQTIYRSDLYDPGTTLAATLILTDPSGEDITALKGQSEYLKVYTANNRYVITSTDGYTYTINKIGSGVGCVAQKTLCEKDGVHFYLHYTGVYRDDGSADLGVPISASINNWFTDSIGVDQYEQSVAVIYQSKYWISITTKSNQKKTFVYDITANAWTDMSNLSFASATEFGNDIDSLRFIFGSRDSGLVMAYGSSSDRGDSITAVVQSGYLDQDDPTILKSYREVFVSGEKTSGVNFTLSLYLQPTSAWTSTAIVGTSTVGNYRVNPLQTTGKAVSVMLTIPNAYGYKHSSMRLGYVGQGSAN